MNFSESQKYFQNNDVFLYTVIVTITYKFIYLSGSLAIQSLYYVKSDSVWRELKN